MDNLLITAAAFLIGLGIGVWATNLWHRFMIKVVLDSLGFDSNEKLQQLADGLMEDLKDKDPAAYAELVKDLDIDTPAIKIRLEQHNGMIYAYREEDNGFIGQGTDYDTVVASIAQRLKNATVEIVNGDMLQKNNA